MTLENQSCNVSIVNFNSTEKIQLDTSISHELTLQILHLLVEKKLSS